MHFFYICSLCVLHLFFLFLKTQNGRPSDKSRIYTGNHAGRKWNEILNIVRVWVCVFLWNVLRIKEWSWAHNVPFISLWCDYIWHTAYFFGFTHTHFLSLVLSLITLAVTSSLPSSLLNYHYGNNVYWKSSLGSPAVAKKGSWQTHTHTTVKHTLSDYYEHTLRWDAFKWSTLLLLK